ncbi:PBP1A family penicillin-binding protein [Salipaludibacillus sp. CUR1]|uniref:transglycosylase domain-containing protein n=1 Tax=Salipaludibacillus sp. CUR1 TaxID=2820003 RepID=UPI001E654640|nr:penicillin-binding protein 1A [Salipaludibacillus sp. CUR1]MCE7792133.1 PBP1A family penicillin-binding protein [Salipaludibacillus sp. CUR1]
MSENNLSRQERKQNNKKRKKPSGGKTSNRSGKFKKIMTALAVILLAMMIAGGISVVAIISGAPDLDQDKLILALNPEIMDKDDELITTLHAAENRRMANINDVPDVLKDAVLSVEDARFYDHFGIDMRRIGGAIRANITGGFGSEGASTITQQVVKNLFFEFDKTITRKLQEQYLAVRLEQQFTKDQILEMYLNAIYFSDSRYGVVEAANYYFSKDLDELTIEDAALLAGIPQRPNAHNPFNNPEGAENRRNTVINRMLNNDKITAEQAEEAMSIPVEDQLQRSERENHQYQAYIDQVLDEVESIDGVEASDIYTGGLKIYTNLDQDLQSHVEHVMQSGDVINYPDDLFQAGITLMETKTGQVRAIGGMREPAQGVRQWNWATNPRRQAGSSIKPILDYGPAIDELKWSTYHQIVDEEYTYSNGTPVRNFTRSFEGSVSMREALKKSLNVPAVKALHEVGLDKAQAFGQSLGIPLDEMHEAYALGANGVSSYQMTGAYGAFGNGGEYNRPHTVRKVEFPDGTVIDLSPEPEQAMNDYTAFMISDMLKDAVQSGTGTEAQIPGLPVAGKTGSSNFTPEDREKYNIPDRAIRDSWFAGYTTELTAAVWTGYPNAEDGQILMNNNEHQISRHIFKAVMSYAHENRETSDFSQPDSVVRVAIEKSTGKLPSDYTPESEIIQEYFVKGTEPSTVSEEFEEAESIRGLKASYDEEQHAISIEWDYPGNLRDEFSFRLEIKDSQSSDYTLVDITKDMQYILENPEYGETYSIRVTALSDEDENLTSDPSTVEVRIPEEGDGEDDELNEENEMNEENEQNEENEENEENELNEENEQNENNEPENNNDINDDNSNTGNNAPGDNDTNASNNENNTETNNEEPNQNEPEEEPENAPDNTDNNEEPQIEVSEEPSNNEDNNSNNS